MKLRLLVMNGQCIVQHEQGGAWTNHKVAKAGELKPGIYNLYGAQPADKARRYDGLIVYLDSNSVFQQVGASFVTHRRSDFAKLPEIGRTRIIAYDAQGQATVSAEAVTLSRGRSR